MCCLQCREEKEESAGWAEYLSSAIVSSATALVPPSISNAFAPWRAFATARLDTAGASTVVEILSVKNESYVMAINSDGVVNVFTLDVESGGECKLILTQK